MQNRRQFVAASGSLAAATLVASGTVKAATAPATTATPPADAFTAVQASSAACIRTGEACVAHCSDELGKGNTAMANCNKRVHEMLAMTKAMLTLSASRSEFAKRTASVCADACKVCAAACLEHKEHWAHGMHLVCKACYEACLECEKSCRALAAS